MIDVEGYNSKYKRQGVTDITFSQMLKKLMEDRDLKTSDLSHATGIPYSTLDSILKRDTKHVKLEIAFKLAEYFGSTLEALVGNGVVRQQPMRTEYKGVKIPVFYNVSGTKSDYAKDNTHSYEFILPEIAGPGEYFGLLISETAMEPRISSGDIAIIKRQADVETNQLAAIRTGPDNACIRKLVKHEGGVTLLAFNPLYEPVTVNRDQGENSSFHILGRVIEIRLKL